MVFLFVGIDNSSKLTQKILSSLSSLVETSVKKGRIT